MLAMVFSQIIGLVAKSLIASTFGTGAETDAYYAANRVPETIFNLMAGGALGSAFIPTFTGLLVDGKRKQAWQLASALANLLVITMTLVAILAALFAPAIIHYVVAPGFAADPAKELMTIELLRIQLISVVFFGLSGLVMGILNAHQQFLLPALTPSMLSFGLIYGCLGLAPEMGIHGLAWGAVIGSILHLTLQLPRLFQMPTRQYFPTLGLNLQPLKTVLLLMLPRLFGVGVVQLNFMVNTIIASLQPEGSLAGINLAFPLMLMPQIAIAQAVAIAALPTFSAQFALGKLDEMRDSLAATLRGVLLLALPAMVGLVLLQTPIVELIYMRSAFDDNSVRLVTWALLWYAFGLPAHSIVEIISRAFYAMQNTRTPVTVGVAAMLLNMALSLLFSWLFGRVGWMPHGGLALANTTATTIEAILLMILIRRKLAGLGGKAVADAVWKGALAAAVMGVAVVLWRSINAGYSALIIVTGGMVIGGLIYGFLLLLLRVPEIRTLITAIKTRLPKRF